jgi:hypothetical protein
VIISAHAGWDAFAFFAPAALGDFAFFAAAFFGGAAETGAAIGVAGIADIFNLYFSIIFLEILLVFYEIEDPWPEFKVGELS